MENILTYTNDEQELIIKKDTNYGCFMHFHNMIELVYYLDGVHLATINSRTKTMTADDITITNKMDIHSYISPNKGHLILLQLNDFFLQSFYACFPTNNAFHRFLQDKEKNRTILPILERLSTVNPNDKLLQISLVNELLHNLVTIYGLKPAADLNTIQNVLIYVREHYAEEISRDFIAEKFGFNPSYFSTMFKKYMGMNFSDYVNYTRYTMVETNLKNNPKKYKKSYIVLSAGFQSMLNYYRFSKKMEKLNATLNDNIDQTIKES